jgi:hypothetical protein
MFPISSESLGHVGRRLIIHYSLSLSYITALATLMTHAKASWRQRDTSGYTNAL